LLGWIDDAECGKLNLDADPNLALYKNFSANNIEILYLRRDIRVLAGLNSSVVVPK
jgi:hypothetical protein